MIQRTNLNLYTGMRRVETEIAEVEQPFEVDYAGACTNEEIVQAARYYLLQWFGRDANIASPNLTAPKAPKLNVTLRTKGLVRGSMSGSGETLQEQIYDAVQRACQDARFTGRLVEADIEDVTIEVWLQTLCEYVPPQSRSASDTLMLGVDGVEVSCDGFYAYYKPSVALTSGFKTAEALYNALCQKAGLPADAWRDPACEVNKTKWIHILERRPGQALPLNALRFTNRQVITPEFIEAWIQSGAEYLRQNQYPNGSFCYKYYPFTNTSRAGKTNPVRASGCAYAMSLGASYLAGKGDGRYIESAKRACSDILKRLVVSGQSHAYVADSDPPGEGGKLGTSALFLLALLCPVCDEPAYSVPMAALLEGIKAAQDSSGLFRCAFGNCVESESSVDFFPGQALLALIRRTEAGDLTCAEHYRAAFEVYRDHFRRRPTTAFVGWHVDVWSRASRLGGNLDYAYFVFEQLDWLLQYQVTSSSDHLFAGGFVRSDGPPNSSSVVFTEAVARGAALAYELGDARWKTYREAFLSGMQFCNRLKLTDCQAPFFPFPRRAVGGVVRSISNFQVRSDVVQHAITLGLAAATAPVLLE
jgi:AMMECR1 domain-containing protein